MKYLISNLKAHKTYQEMLLYKDELLKLNLNNVNFILAPSVIYLPLFKDVPLTLATQDLSLNNTLNLTGDICIDGLKSLDVKYAIIGHYERRKYYQEDDQKILEKIKLALANNIKVIYCIGEALEELERKVDLQILEKQIARIFNYINISEFSNIIIAYEPTYLIGGNKCYDLKKIKENISFIKLLVKEYYHTNIQVVYGGNINLENIDDFLTIPNLDGFIIGNFSLKPSNIQKIIEIMTVND